MDGSTEKGADGWEYTIIDNDDEPARFWEDAAIKGIHIVIGLRASDEDPEEDEQGREHPPARSEDGRS